MINKRPLIVFTDTDGKYVVLGGNMRLKALKELNYKEVPIILADEWTEEQKAEFLIKDNVGFGEWDWDSLANEWDTERLDEWGLDLPIIMDEPSYEDLIGEEKNKPATMKITFTSPEQLQKAEIEIQELLDRNYLGAYFSVSAGEI
jgi:ParB-like chromosome segregation protein Spo0J